MSGTCESQACCCYGDFNMDVEYLCFFFHLLTYSSNYCNCCCPSYNDGLHQDWYSHWSSSYNTDVHHDLFSSKTPQESDSGPTEYNNRHRLAKDQIF